MPRLLIGAVSLFLASCAPAQVPIPVHGETPGHSCKAIGIERFIGLAGTGERGAAILRSTNAAVLRWAPIGMMLTMDYRADRVTVRLGPDRKITAISCG